MKINFNIQNKSFNYKTSNKSSSFVAKGLQEDTFSPSFSARYKRKDINKLAQFVKKICDLKPKKASQAQKYLSPTYVMVTSTPDLRARKLINPDCKVIDKMFESAVSLKKNSVFFGAIPLKSKDKTSLGILNAKKGSVIKDRGYFAFGCKKPTDLKYETPQILRTVIKTPKGTKVLYGNCADRYAQYDGFFPRNSKFKVIQPKSFGKDGVLEVILEYILH